MHVRRCRRAAAIYLLLFFGAVALAPHTHVNGLEDLLLDQPSDSGVIPLPAARPMDGRAVLASVRYVQDVPCLACFTRDFVASPAAVFGFVAILAPLPVRPAPAAVARPELLPAETSSRSPPRSS
jgi:hypothetical protein